MWRPAIQNPRIELVDPATEDVFEIISDAEQADVEEAVAAAKAAFSSFSATPKGQRVALLRRIAEVYDRRKHEISETIIREIGAPKYLAEGAHAQGGSLFLRGMADTLESFEFDVAEANTLVMKEPIGVCALITPWNWPINQIVNKVAPALAAGCTMVLKPSEIAPLTAMVFADMLHEAGVPKGVFNLINGYGPRSGAWLAAHPDIDMVSFTGSTRAGTEISRVAAASIKRVTLELGGKSANILLDDADFTTAVPRAVELCFNNSGQTCNAPTRLVVPRSKYDEICALAVQTAENISVGSPHEESTKLGPVANETQFTKIQQFIEAGTSEGARILTGGPGRPAGLTKGFYVKPTIFADVQSSMTIAQQEIFGPVLVVIAYDDDDDAVRIANDSPYGLAGDVQSSNVERARAIARRVRAGTVRINYPPLDRNAPMGGYRMSGNGRERGVYGLHEYLEIKAIMGFGAGR
ncbi:aldehyde dehydrogenase family protein [Agrobacterium sp. ICMP 6402]|nr:aldehyde dehydrogenase family protein [Agrobacterium sp. ICMP 6402]MQB12368.1 aldehyde dehydrogenase family protein [Agrobacterium sp. ICMP 6402]